ncbi:MAG: MCE family protein, partial [Bacteroidales bacterium]|nr:MCE family protein [Bacteroidales bacterium]
MKFSSEAKVGLIGIVTLAVLIWGINYLKGRNILSNSYSLIAFYDDAAGLESSAPVIMKGVKIGYVDEVTLLADKKNAIRVTLNIEQTYPVRQGSVGELFSADLLGTKAVRIIRSESGEFFKHNDTINSSVATDLLANIQEQVQPVMEQVHSLAVTIDTLAKKLDAILVSETTEKTLQHLASISGSLEESLARGGTLDQSFSNMESFTAMLKSQEEEVTLLVRHLNSIGQSLDSANLGQVAEGLDAVSYQFEKLL